MKVTPIPLTLMTIPLNSNFDDIIEQALRLVPCITGYFVSGLPSLNRTLKLEKLQKSVRIH